MVFDAKLIFMVIYESALKFIVINVFNGQFNWRFGFMVFNATFNNIGIISWTVNFVGERNRSTLRKLTTCRKSLTNVIT